MWIKKGDELLFSVLFVFVLKEVVVVNLMLMLFLFEECNDLLDYGNWWMNGLCCLFDLLCCEVNVIVLIDDKVLMMISCEVGVYNIIDLVWIVLCKKLLVLCSVWLCLLFNNG